MLTGAARYLEVPGTGCSPQASLVRRSCFRWRLALRPARVVLQLGRPIRAAALVARRMAIDA